MAVCRRVLRGLRPTLLLARAHVGLVERNVSSGFGFAAAGGEAEVGTSTSIHSPWCWQAERLSFAARDAGRDAGWSSWWHLTRGLHGTAWREEGEDEGEKRSGDELMRGRGGLKEEAARVANEEARNLVQHVHLASLKKKLRDDARDTISYEELLQLCQTVGMASDKEDASKMAHAFNDAGVVITFRDKVHLHPEKVRLNALWNPDRVFETRYKPGSESGPGQQWINETVYIGFARILCFHDIAELVANVLPLSLLGEDDQRRLELMAMAKKKEEIDKKAHKQMRFVLWLGLCGLTLQMLVFFRLTFWELSWDVMEPIAFFATGTGLICGYTYFMFTSRDPSYQDFMQRIYHSRQRKLFRKQNFDIKRYKELQMQCETGWKPLTKKILEDAD